MINDIFLEIYDLPKSYLACTLLAFTLIIHTAFKYWITSKKKEESLLVLMHKMILPLESANQDLQNRLLNLESANLMQELQSINNKCKAKIGFVDNKYEYLMDRTLTLQSKVVTTQTLCKEERLSLTNKIRSLESCVSEEHNRWYDSMKNLESQAREDVHSLEKTLCARLQALEETPCKHDKEHNKQKGKTIKVVTSPNGSNPMAYPVIIHERPADDTHPEPYVTHTLQPISIRDFKNMKEAIVTYGIHSTYIKQMLNSWSTSNRIIPDDWHQLTSAVLEYSQQLQWKSWLREEARNLEQQGILMQREDVILEWIFLPCKPNKKDCSLKIQEPEVPSPWFLDPGGWSKTAAVNLYFIFPGICTLSLAKMGRRQCKSAYSIIKNKTTPESSPPPTPKSDYCNADKAEENDLKKSLMKMLEEAFEEK
ncbi:hypothetical protein STEG23_034170 [Scotinomys teguina]